MGKSFVEQEETGAGRWRDIESLDFINTGTW